jgi:3-hydroxyisobutyrate dehydrogenase
VATQIPSTQPGRTRLGWVGTGVMGTSMCGRLLAAEYAVTVSSRTRERAQPLVDAGARWADTASEVAAASDVVFTMVGFPSDVGDVVLGPQGVLAGARAGAILVDMTTSEPALAARIAAEAGARGVHVLDAPVSGGDVGARNGTLSIMVGGDRAAMDAVLPAFEVMGSTVVHHGAAGAGQHAKMVNQILIAGTLAGVAEALVYAKRADLDADAVLRSVSTGAAQSWTLANLAPRALAGDFAPGFYVDHFVKDLAIALAEARVMRLSMPTLGLVEQLCVALQAAGHGRQGTQALMLLLAELNGVEWSSPAGGAEP